MFEFFKIVWDAIVLRDSARKGQLKVRRMLFGLGFAVLLYAIGLPAGILYARHPQYKPLFIAAMVLDGLLVVGFIVIAGGAYLRSLRTPVSPAEDSSASSRQDVAD